MAWLLRWLDELQYLACDLVGPFLGQEVPAIRHRAPYDVLRHQGDHLAHAVALGPLSAERDDRNPHLARGERRGLLHRREHSAVDTQRAEDSLTSRERPQVLVDGRAVNRPPC